MQYYYYFDPETYKKYLAFLFEVETAVPVKKLKPFFDEINRVLKRLKNKHSSANEIIEVLMALVKNIPLKDNPYYPIYALLLSGSLRHPEKLPFTKCR